ncbi:MAG: SEC-C metal-binding domain-containing protein [Acidobacteriota bacterium]|nr:SEC-C metal-binding domain-containing protein [Acidobacteriota bacterium]
MAKMKQYNKVVWPGFSNAPAPRHVAKIGRNDRCPCGSGRKYKDCHQSEGTAFLEKLARAEDKQRLRELRQHLKEQGVPWYRRLFARL